MKQLIAFDLDGTLLFVGDAIYPGGNDYVAREAGVGSIGVRDVAETRTVIAAITPWNGK
ncbi:MAG: hypothetical protein H7Y89_00495 [Steroidobacteraceae bacterium]|nr:hypothetical protein [Steroidobacteraceae bacterium]